MSTTAKLTIAIAKGYLWDPALNCLRKAGISIQDDNSRKLYLDDNSGNYRILRIRPWDVPVYVESGVADLGIVGKDVLLEKNHTVYELKDLGFGHCELVIAGPEKTTPDQYTFHLKVATKYVKSCERYFRQKGLQIQPVELYGAVELAPLTGLSDLICDLTATGQTLKENNLHIIDTVFSSTARLVANPVSMRFCNTQICELIKQLPAVH